jgi:hypothetical protein
MTDKVLIDADLLSAKDMRRARVALGGRDPWELLRGNQEDRAVLIAWCQLSRDNPELTWDAVDEANFGTYVEVTEDEDADRPPEGLTSSNGSRPEKNASKPNASAASRSRSSAASTT